MAYEIKFKENNTQLWVVYTGDITIGEIEDSWIERTTDIERFKQVEKIVADYSNASLKQLSTEDVIKGAQWTKNAAKLNPNITLIAFQPSDLEYGLGRMWDAYTTDSEFKWKLVQVKSEEEVIRLLYS